MACVKALLPFKYIDSHYHLTYCLRIFCSPSGCLAVPLNSSPIVNSSSIPLTDISAPKLNWVGKVERFFVSFREHLVWVHLFTFTFFLTLILLPLFLDDPQESDTALSHFTVLANYLMWGLWFPLVFLSVIFSGRSWCGILCPMGAASEWANKLGLQRDVPAWLRWQGTPIVSFLFITVLGQTVGVRDHPEAIAQVFGGTMLLAIIIGFIYGQRKRAWCRHMCPIGLLLGVFSRMGAVQFTPKKPKGSGEGYTNKGICPTMIDIPRKTESRHCIECFRCVNPKAKGGLKLEVRHPGREIENIKKHNPNLAELWFLFLGTGMAIGGFLWLILPGYTQLRLAVAEWFIDREMYWIGDSGPSWLMSVHPERREVFTWLDFLCISGFMMTYALALALLLFAVTFASAGLSKRFGGNRSIRLSATQLGYQFAPVAMVSLILGLGAELFSPLYLFLSVAQVGWIKGGVFALSLAWSIHLGNRILANQGVSSAYRWLALLPSMAGSLMVALLWWPAIFGI